jgi:hypothetical protein
MVRAKLWLQCAAMKDPVAPVLVRPAAIGWQGKFRQIDLTIDRPFSGEELLLRMKGWVTTDPREVIGEIKPEGFVKLFDQGEVVVETDTPEQLAAVQKRLRDRFGDRVSLEPLDD